mmetsp:Transcript_3303/g.12713  ORF Transcript_3303/g.12713 Transcript_3303/m.12713 type:complete len:296 (+) Transcript_3303:674-1561(+)
MFSCVCSSSNFRCTPRTRWNSSTGSSWRQPLNCHVGPCAKTATRRCHSDSASRVGLSTILYVASTPSGRRRSIVTCVSRFAPSRRFSAFDTKAPLPRKSAALSSVSIDVVADGTTITYGSAGREGFEDDDDDVCRVTLPVVVFSPPRDPPAAAVVAAATVSALASPFLFAASTAGLSSSVSPRGGSTPTLSSGRPVGMPASASLAPAGGVVVATPSAAPVVPAASSEPSVFPPLFEALTPSSVEVVVVVFVASAAAVRPSSLRRFASARSSSFLRRRSSRSAAFSFSRTLLIARS